MILLTGATGFIGKHLLSALKKKFGADNIVVLTSKKLADCKYLLHEDYKYDENLFLNAGFENIDTIIHAGAFIPKSSVDSNNISKSNSNIENTYKLLSTKLPILKRIIFLSTVDVYKASATITEDSNVDPISMYGQSKLYCEKMITTWGNQNNVVPQILRIGHVYGPGEEAYSKLIPIIIKQVQNNETVTIYGDGSELRAFIYIQDVVEAILNSIEFDEYLGPINIASGSSLSVKDVIDKIIKLGDSTIEIEKKSVDNSGRDLVFDIHKMKKLLHTPQIDFDEGIRLEYEYMEEQLG